MHDLRPGHLSQGRPSSAAARTARGPTSPRCPLSRTGTIWSYTDARYQPPEPYRAADPYEPFAIAAVELADEKMVVMGQVVPGVGVEDLTVGTEVELVLDTLYEDDEHEYLVWKWRPLGAGGSPGSSGEPATNRTAREPAGA